MDGVTLLRSMWESDDQSSMLLLLSETAMIHESTKLDADHSCWGPVKSSRKVLFQDKKTGRHFQTQPDTALCRSELGETITSLWSSRKSHLAAAVALGLVCMEELSVAGLGQG